MMEKQLVPYLIRSSLHATPYNLLSTRGGGGGGVEDRLPDGRSLRLS